MTTESTPPDVSAAPASGGPVRDPRPRSAIAVWALASTIVLLIVAFFTGLLWLVLIPAVVLGVIALIRINPQVSRGHGMAIVSLVIAVLAGSCQYWFSGLSRRIAEHLASGVLAGVAAEDPGQLDLWLTEKAVTKGEADRIRARFATVVERMGPYKREVSSGSPLFGLLPIMVPPSDVEGIGPGDDSTRTARAGGFWIIAHFEGGPVHVEMLLGEDAQSLQKDEIEKGQPIPIVEDMYFYVAKGGA